MVTVVTWCLSIVLAVLLMLLVGCSKDDDQGTISGAGDERSDRVRDGGPVAKAKMPNQDDGSPQPTATSSGACSKDYMSYGTRNGGRQAWRIPQKGPEFGIQGQGGVLQWPHRACSQYLEKLPGERRLCLQARYRTERRRGRQHRHSPRRSLPCMHHTAIDSQMVKICSL